ncbi:hypothetical protein BsWGS_21703 [Bradybaena similaris]
MAVDDMRPVCSQSAMVDIKEEHSRSDSGGKTCPIHSGHFMVSRVHDDVNNDDDDEEVASPFQDEPKGFVFQAVDIKEPSMTCDVSHADAQAVVIDASLTKLFQCMTLAYSGKITSPRWKQFRGMHLTQKQRIRLNNLIWREWHMQYIYGKLPIVCQFAVPLSDHIHSKPEAVVLEGKYWKRQLDTVTAEYKKWRRYFKDRIRGQQHLYLLEDRSLNERELLERVKEVTFISHSSGSYVSNTDLNLLQADMMDMDFTNELFANLNQPFAFPNPRELSQLGYADFIQPGLVQLQPNLEEFMDTDSMQELFSSRLPSSLSSTFAADSSQNIDLTLGGIQNADISLENFLSYPSGNSSGSISTSAVPIESSVSPVLGNCNTSSFVPGNVSTAQNIMLQLTTGQYQFDPATVLLRTQLSQDSPQTFTIVPTELYSNIQNIVSSSANNSHKILSAPTVMSSSDLLTQLLQQRGPEMVTLKKDLQQPPTPIQPAPSLNQHRQAQQSLQQRIYQPSIASQAPILAQSLSIQPHVQQSPQTVVQPNHTHKKSIKVNKVNKNTSSSDSVGTGSGVPKTSGNHKKKDGPFTVPVAKPLILSRKNRVIAPAPPPAAAVQQAPVIPSPSSQASYLAELLKNGTYPGAYISVKKEAQLTSANPIKTTTNLYQQSRVGHGSAFSSHVPTTVAMAAASSVNPGQTHLPSVTGAAVSTVAAPLMTSQDISSLIFSSMVNLPPSPPPLTKESAVTFSHMPDTKIASPVSHLPQSPVANPPVVNRTPSPIPTMDASSLVDPLSPFSSSITMSPTSIVSPGEPESPGSLDSFPLDNRRAAHLSAEQKRRCNLKTGFDLLQQLVPSLTQNPKVSKATMLQKTAEYCKKLKAERSQMQKEAAILKKEIDTLNSAISNVQSQLPETGVPVTRQRKDQMKEMFDEYVRIRTNGNSKFWIFSVIMNSLFDSYSTTVSTASMEDLCRTSLTWLDQSCSLVTLRPNVLNALRKLSTSTPILTEPQRMKEHALQAVARQSKQARSNILMSK